ncbi:hypothetical protein HK405_007334 [Cladochytrium tenue]|nr:hypothetical protein HK405_007334 [Cladochytrium tenue]
MSSTNPFHAGIPDVEWYSIHIVALSVIVLSAVGSLYIIVLTLVKASRESVLPIQLLPMFISMADGITNLFHGIDHAISLAHGRVLDGPGCVALGFGTYFGINSTPFWVSACAVYVHLCIVHERRPVVGPGALYMNLVCWGGPLIINIVALILGEFGSEALWCGLPHSIVYFNVWVLAAGLIVCAIMYAWTWLHIMSKAAKTTQHQGLSDSSGSGSGSGAARVKRPSRFQQLRHAESVDSTVRAGHALSRREAKWMQPPPALPTPPAVAPVAGPFVESAAGGDHIELGHTSRSAAWLSSAPLPPTLSTLPRFGPDFTDFSPGSAATVGPRDYLDAQRDAKPTASTPTLPSSRGFGYYSASAAGSSNEHQFNSTLSQRDTTLGRSQPAQEPTFPPGYASQPGGSGVASGRIGGAGWSDSNDLGRKLRRAANRLPIFVLIFIIQWTPFAVYAFYVLAGQTQFWVTLLVVFLSNSGGVWNAIAYRRLIVASESRR